ncbi:MAG TPA: VacB/RNase II family 3'-5' exoribonuclease, partial [Acetobacteraceae bacterium]|nr:VacB/RNase II family 3'-5' exoribonuclease [Acetobacteraceae bacterium]
LPKLRSRAPFRSRLHPGKATRETETVLGVYRPAPLRQGRGEAGHILPVDRRVREPWRVPAGAAGGAEAGEIVRAELLPGPQHGARRARVTERLGRFDGVESFTRIAISSLGIPEEFSAEALREAAAARAVGPEGREDLRALPLVTIDGADARDFDDAVFAAPAGEGFRIIVAIADVAHYVRRGSALDAAARQRGNSVYFPGRVVPMLPPALSEHWCSLAPHAERGVVFAEIEIAANGEKRRHRFGRGLMRSAARLTYEAVQRAAERGEDLGLPAGTLANLYAAWRALSSARRTRGPLDLDLPERRVVLDAAGALAAVASTPRLESHRLIEDFMILAKVAAAEEILRGDLPGLFRAHPEPAPDKIASLAAFLRELGLRLPARERITPRDLTATLAPLAGTEAAGIAAERTLQSLPQAGYSPENAGHFGLALAAYAHFTSPIRRYADLVVHRALIGGLGLGAGGNAKGDAGKNEDTAASLAALARDLGTAERRAVEAERAVLARAQAALLARRIGGIEEARISGVTRSLLFVTLIATGAEGIVPVSTLPADSWRFEEATTSLRAVRSGRRLGLGERLSVRLAEADPVSGRIVMRVASLPAGPSRPARGGGRNRLR